MNTTQEDSLNASTVDQDRLPRFAIGHVSMEVQDVDRLTDFYTTIGMRHVVNLGQMSIVELRGGTHLILQSGRPGQATLDFIVDDIDDTRSVLEASGAEVGVIRRGNPHDTFVASDPEGNTLHIHSTHAIGPV